VLLSSADAKSGAGLTRIDRLAHLQDGCGIAAMLLISNDKGEPELDSFSILQAK
jgi:hypothetical protein